MSFLQFSFSKRFLKIFFFPCLLFLIQACSQTPIGEKLSNSFDAPIDQNSTNDSDLNKVNTSSGIKSKEKIVSKAFSSKNTNLKKDNRVNYSKNRFQSQMKTEEKSSSFVPQPYRITIKLSAANPSAPAETVTKALRLAGVIFEVEMIQLIENQSSIKEIRPGRSKR